MNFDNLPKGWKSVELDEVVYIRKGTINPQDYPEEILSYTAFKLIRQLEGQKLSKAEILLNHMPVLVRLVNLPYKDRIQRISAILKVHAEDVIHNAIIIPKGRRVRVLR